MVLDGPTKQKKRRTPTNETKPFRNRKDASEDKRKLHKRLNPNQSTWYYLNKDLQTPQVSPESPSSTSSPQIGPQQQVCAEPLPVPTIPHTAELENAVLRERVDSLVLENMSLTASNTNLSSALNALQQEAHYWKTKFEMLLSLQQAQAVEVENVDRYLALNPSFQHFVENQEPLQFNSKGKSLPPSPVKKRTLRN